MKFIFSIIVIVIGAFGIAFPTFYNNEYSYRQDFKPIPKTFTVSMIILALIILIFVNSFTVIPTGYSGVRSTFGQISSEPIQDGFNWKLPFVQKITKVNNKQQDIFFEGKVWSETNSRAAIYYDGVNVTFQIGADKSAWIYANVTNYKDSLINASVVSSAIKSSSKTLSDIEATNRSIIEPLVAENLQKSLDKKYGKGVVFINKVVIETADFEDSYNEAIANKQKAQLEAEKQEIENQKLVDKAKAEAEAKLIAAQAEADANELLEKSLTETIIEEMWIDKWDGKLPTYVVSDDTSLMIGLTD